MRFRVEVRQLEPRALLRCLIVAKRVVDVALTVAALPILVPVAAVIALLVRARLGSPVFFEQERLGLGANRFRIKKFRTMRNAVDSKGELLPDAERLTPLGQWLRRLSLDELPEFWLVIAGRMSLVGPRPLPAVYADHYNEHHARRHEVRPGITGLAQVSGRNSLSWKQRLDLDVEYVDTHTLMLDLRILVRSVTTVLKSEGISAEGHATMTDLRFDPELGGGPPQY